MKMDTREKLKLIQDIFPDERVEKSKERWRRVWEHEEPLDRFAFTFDTISFNYYDTGETPEERFQMTLDELIARKGIVDDFIPTIFPGCKQSTMPSLFGAEEIVVNGDYSAERIINSVEDFKNIPDPELKAGTPAWEWLEMQKYLLDVTDGAFPIHVTDSQGPLDIAGSMSGYDQVLLLPYVDETVYFDFMNKVADAFIMYWNLQKELLGDLFVGTHLGAHEYVPPSFGCAVSADCLIMLSEDFYVSFYDPIIKRISDSLGGVCIHSCGNWAQVMKVVTDADFITGVHTGEMTTKETIDAGMNPNTVLSDFTHYTEMEEHFEVIRKRQIRATSIMVPSAPDNVPFNIYNEMILSEAQRVN